jgi:hypothetical protein
MLFQVGGRADRAALPDSVIRNILGRLHVHDLFALRAVSKEHLQILNRVFSAIHPRRQIRLASVLREPGLWDIGGLEHRRLNRIRELYSASQSGPVVVLVYVEIAYLEDESTHSCPRPDQIAVLTDGFLSRGDDVHLYIRPRCFIQSGREFEKLSRFSTLASLVSVSVEAGPLKIWQIEALRKVFRLATLKRLCLTGVAVPLADESSGKKNKKKKDGSNEIRRVLLGLPGLVDLSLASTGLVIGPLVPALSLMTRMESLDLRKTHVDPKEAADVISCMPGLRSLALSWIHGAFTPRLASVIFSLSLTKLSLNRCGITDARVLSSAAVSGRSTIETLDLSENRLSSVDGISALLDSLPLLREMDLQETLADHDELVPVLVAHPSVKTTLSFPLRGRLADHDDRRSIELPGHILWFPVDHYQP